MLNLNELLILAVLTATLHWLIARAEITRPIWSRASGGIDKLLRCAGCSGFWLGLGLGIIGLRPIDSGIVVADVAVTGLLSVFFTPVFEAVLIWGLERSAIGPPADPPVGPAVGTDE